MTLQIAANNFGKWGTSPDDHRLDTVEFERYDQREYPPHFKVT